MADLASLVVKLEAQTAQYDAKLDQATKKLHSFSTSTNKLLKDFAGAFAAAFTIEKLVRFGEAALENADRLNKLSQSSGVGVEALSKLQFAAKQSGVDTEALGIALKKLNISISTAAGDAKSDAAVAFKAMGISVTDASGRTKAADVVFAELATRFKGYKDGANKVALANTLMGKTADAIIPALNLGADGLAKLADQAQRAGLVISKETAAAAEEFNDKVSLLKATLIDGLANRIAAKLLPTLDGLATSFLDTATGADALDSAANGVVIVFKTLLDAGLTVGRFFEGLGKSIGATAAIIVQVLHGNFKEAAEIVRQRNADGIKEDEKFHKRIDAIWQAGGNKIVKNVKDTAKKLEEEAPNLLGKKKIAQAVEDALKKLGALNDGIAEQILTLDAGAVAAQRYKLEHGELAKAIEVTGAAGKRLKEDILLKTAALEFDQTRKAVADLGAQIKDLTGNTVGAALDQFDSANAQLLNQLTEIGDQKGLQQLATLRDLTAAQAQFNKLQEEASRIESDLAIAEERINNSRNAGAITELESLKQLGEVRKNAADELGKIKDGEDRVAEASGNPALIQNAKRFEASLESLRNQTDLLGEKVKAVFEDAFGNSFADLITGAASAHDAIMSFLKDVEAQFARIIAKNFAEKIFGGLTGGGGGILGSLGNALGGILGGAHADGGTIPAGKVGLVGERGPELAYAGASSLNIVPNSKLGGANITNNFTIQAPGGVVSRASQMQVAAAVAQGLARANRRNN